MDLIDMESGKVKWFSREKGYGFITSDTSISDHYFHVSAVVGADLPSIGDSVNFEGKENDKGLYADRVTITDVADGGSSQNVICQICNKSMVPRVVFSGGEPDRSICPFCGSVHKQLRTDFDPVLSITNFIYFYPQYFIGAVVVLIASWYFYWR